MASGNLRKKARIEKEAVRIPEDAIVEILKRLPVKSLVRFRSVSKPWCALVSDPYFSNKLHQKRACMLICRRENSFSTLTMNGGNPILSSTIFSLPWQKQKFSTKFLGSCNGLVSFQCSSSSCPNLNGLFLWNPSTRKLRKLPPSSKTWFEGNTYTGFGYDESAEDYKFVWMVCKPPRAIEFDVFSFKSNTWRRYDHHSSDIALSTWTGASMPRLTGVHSNGALHWIIRCEENYNSLRVVALDLAASNNNNCRLLETPQYLASKTVQILVVSLSGCLCLCIHYVLEDIERVDLWMMKEYGVDSSWLKLTCFPTHLYPISILYPILFSEEEGKIVAMVKVYSQSEKVCYEIIRFQVEKGEAVKGETLLEITPLKKDSSARVFNVLDAYCLLHHMKESLVEVPFMLEAKSFG